MRATSLPRPCGCQDALPSTSLPETVPRHCPAWTAALSVSSLKRRPSTSSAPSLRSTPPHSTRVSPPSFGNRASQRSISSALTAPLTQTPGRSGSGCRAAEAHHAARDRDAIAFGAPQQIHAEDLADGQAQPVLAGRQQAALEADRQRFRGGLRQRRRQVDRQALQARLDQYVRGALAGRDLRAPVGGPAQALHPGRAAGGAARVVGIDAPLNADTHCGVAAHRSR